MINQAQEFLQRHCPQWAEQIQFEAKASGWEIASAGGFVVIRGASLLEQAVALRHYLEAYAGLCLAYSGTAQRVSFTLKGKKLPLPVAAAQGELPQQTRACFNPLTFSGSACWWDWERWQDEVDILALYGCNEALLLTGSAFAWFKALREEGISAEFILSGMSAPPFWPRQMQGHFDSILPPVDPMFLKSQGQLGRAIADRMRAWGITPVFPACPCTVSAQMNGILKGANLVPQPSWNGYRSVCKIDCSSQGYARLQTAYKKQMTAIYGEAERYWDLSDELQGHVLPAEGRTVLHGNAAQAVNITNAEACRADEPESNPLLYTLYMEGLTRTQPEDLDARLKKYAACRYGTQQNEGYAALRLLCDSAYAQDSPAPGSVFCMRPAMQLEPTGPGDAVQVNYSCSMLFKSAEQLLALKSDTTGWHYDLCDILRQALSIKARKSYALAMESFTQKDVRGFERGANDFLTLLEDCDRLLRCEEAFRLSYHLLRASKCAKIDAEKNNFELALLLQHSLYGAGGVRKKQGYLLHGMAWREWGDLLGSLHSRRWRGFFKHLAAHFGERKFSLETKEKSLGRSAYMGNKFYEQMSEMEMEWLRNYTPAQEEPETLREVAEELCRKYSNDEN